jgi:hypothetical protein
MRSTIDKFISKDETLKRPKRPETGTRRIKESKRERERVREKESSLKSLSALIDSREMWGKKIYRIQ